MQQHKTQQFAKFYLKELKIKSTKKIEQQGSALVDLDLPFDR